MQVTSSLIYCSEAARFLTVMKSADGMASQVVRQFLPLNSDGVIDATKSRLCFCQAKYCCFRMVCHLFFQVETSLKCPEVRLPSMSKSPGTVSWRLCLTDADDVITLLLLWFPLWSRSFFAVMNSADPAFFSSVCFFRSTVMVMWWGLLTGLPSAGGSSLSKQLARRAEALEWPSSSDRHFLSRGTASAQLSLWLLKEEMKTHMWK